MTTVSTFSQLKKAVNDVANKALLASGSGIVKIVQEEVDSTVYSAYSPTIYERTYELSSSIESKASGNGIEISHNLGKIGSYAPNQHMSIFDGSDFSKHIPKIVHDGGTPNVFNDKAYVWQGSRPYMDNARNRFNSKKEHLKIMRDELGRLGIKCK